MIAVFVAQLVIDAARARLAAEPARRSAVVALGAGVKLVVKRPLQAVSVGLSSTLLALAVAAVLLVVRQQIAQSGALSLLLAFALAQLAVAAIAWGHAARLCGLVEIARELVGSQAAAAAPRAAHRDGLAGEACTARGVGPEAGVGGVPTAELTRPAAAP